MLSPVTYFFVFVLLARHHNLMKNWPIAYIFFVCLKFVLQ